MMRRIPSTVCTALLAVSVLAACVPNSPLERERVASWLTCEECGNGELDSVVRGVGLRAVPLLESALEGPTDNQLVQVDEQLHAAYTRIVSYRSSGGVVRPPSDRATWVARHKSGFTANYQRRAAHALGQLGAYLGGVRSFIPRAVLEDALLSGRPYRQDVVREIEQAIRFASDSTYVPS